MYISPLLIRKCLLIFAIEIHYTCFSRYKVVVQLVKWQYFIVASTSFLVVALAVDLFNMRRRPCIYHRFLFVKVYSYLQLKYVT